MPGRDTRNPVDGGEAVKPGVENVVYEEPNELFSQANMNNFENSLKPESECLFTCKILNIDHLIDPTHIIIVCPPLPQLSM